MNIILYLVGIASIIEGVVLDPALYLAPSPPLTTTHDNNAEKLWSLSVESRMTNKEHVDPSHTENSDEKTSLRPELMEESETFWPSYRASSLKGIYVPLSFHLSGTYGGNSGSGVYSSGYMKVPEAYGAGQAVLAGTNYKSYRGNSGIKIYGSDSRPSWGGWGNGKWGHYGKG